MEQLSAAQLRRAISAIAELDAIADLAEYPSHTARLLAKLISCEVTSYNAVDPRRRRARVAADPAESVFEGGAELFAAYAHQNPLVGHYAATADGSANRISDFISRRQLHATELYNYVYRRIGVEYQLAITLASPLGPGEVIGLTLSRGGRDFSAAEKALLDVAPTSASPSAGSAIRRWPRPCWMTPRPHRPQTGFWQSAQTARSSG